MNPADATMVDHLVALFCAPESVYGGDDPGLHRPRLAFEWSTGQWTMLTGENVEFLGWASWYRCDDAVLEALQRGEADDWVRARRFPVLTAGPHCYIADVVVVPGAPAGAYRTLIDLVGGLNSDARSLSGHMLKRDGRERFAIRMNRGERDWWRHCQSDWQRLHGG